MRDDAQNTAPSRRVHRWMRRHWIATYSRSLSSWRTGPGRAAGGRPVLRLPDDEVYGEEAGTTAGTSGRRWVIDPINGTWYFAHRSPIFTVEIAVEDEHGPAVGVHHQPVARQIVYAGRRRECRVRTGDVEITS